MRKYPCLRRLSFGRNAHKELENRTRGFDVVVLSKHPWRTSIWDFAGQREFYALYDYLFPDVQNSCFVYVCSCRCPPNDAHPEGKIKTEESMKKDCLYWMKFLSSNTKPRQGTDEHGAQLPYVKFVLTNTDTLGWKQSYFSKQWAKSVVVELKGLFHEVIDLCETVDVVNSHSLKDMGLLMDEMNAKLEEILKNRREYSICNEVRSALDELSAKELSKPILSLKEFHTMCEDQLRHAAPMAYSDAKLYLKKNQTAALSYLNDLGDIIYHDGLDFIVVNPRWFGKGILGNLIDAFEGGWKFDSDNGFVKRSSLESLLKQSLHMVHLEESVSVDSLVALMIRMEMCFQKTPQKNDSPLFFPALCSNEIHTAAMGKPQLEWAPGPGPFVYRGRRLECKNRKITFLTPGFFPRLQVSL